MNEEIIEVTVSEKGTDNLVAQVFKDEEGIKVIYDKDFNVDVKTSGRKVIVYEGKTRENKLCGSEVDV